MKKLIAVAVTSLAVFGLGTPRASAWFGCGCCHKCCATICCKQYNAFSPCCPVSIKSNGCCPILTPWYGPGYGGGWGMPACSAMDGGECCDGGSCAADGHLPSGAKVISDRAVGSPSTGSPGSSTTSPPNAPMPGPASSGGGPMTYAPGMPLATDPMFQGGAPGYGYGPAAQTGYSPMPQGSGVSNAWTPPPAVQTNAFGGR